MRITPELAEPIVTQLKNSLQYDVLMMDEQGVVVASNKKHHLKQHHKGALRVLASKQEVVLTAAECQHLPYTQPGIYLPVSFQDRIAGVVGIVGDPAQLQPFSQLIHITVEALFHQYYMNSLEHYQQHAITAWVKDLIHPFTFDEHRLTYLSYSLSLDITLSRSVFLLESDLDSTPKPPPRQTLRALSHLFDPRSICTKLDSNTFFIAVPIKKAGGEKKLAQRVQAQLKTRGLQLRMGIGKAVTGLKGYRESYLQASQSLQLQKKFNVRKPIHAEDWGIIRLIASVPSHVQKEFFQSHGKAFARLNDEDTKTLETFLNCELNVSQAAAKLHIHRNTLLYRLKQIVSTLRLDPRRFEDAVLIYFFLIYHKLHQKND